jgi:enoyl-CoA hydratase
MWLRIGQVFAQLATERTIRVILVRGAGGRAFSAGADISEFRDERLGAAAAARYNTRIGDALRAVRRTPQPVVAMIVGLAVGGGCELATACDLRIASEDARFGIPVARLGVTLGIEEITGLVGLVGPGRAKDLLFTGRLIDAAEAHRIGLVDYIVPRHDLEDTSWQLAETVARAAPTAAMANKLAVGMVTYGPDDEDADRLRSLTDSVYEGRDLAEGVDAFLAKRDPTFVGD